MDLRPDMFDPVCPTRAVPFRIGDKWTAMIVLCLEDGPRRFHELRVPLPRITPKVLSETLRAMARDGLVTRTDHATNPPHVDYELTPLGRSLLPLIDTARDWCRANLPDLEAARASSRQAD